MISHVSAGHVFGLGTDFGRHICVSDAEAPGKRAAGERCGAAEIDNGGQIHTLQGRPGPQG